MKFFLAVLAIFFSSSLSAQNINGKWYGEIWSSGNNHPDTCRLEFVFSSKIDAELSAEITCRDKDSVCSVTLAEGRFERSEKKIILFEKEILENKRPDDLPFYFLKYSLDFSSITKEIGGTATCVLGIDKENPCTGATYSLVLRKKIGEQQSYSPMRKN